jgi:hypothetical protein
MKKRPAAILHTHLQCMQASIFSEIFEKFLGNDILLHGDIDKCQQLGPEPVAIVQGALRRPFR